MRKHSILLTVIVAILLVALCMGALELSNKLLPDYQDAIEEISLSENQSILTVNNRETALVYPWDIYESEKENLKLVSAAPTDFDAVYPDKQISRLIEIFSPFVSNGYETIEWQTKMEYLDDKENLFFFIKDITFTDNLGDNYLVNIAFTDERLLYYSCDRITSKTISSEIRTASYEKLNSDYTMFRETYKKGIYDNGNGESESDGSDRAAIMLNDNCFELFILKVIDLEYSEIAWSGLDPALADFDDYKYSYLISSMVSESTAA